MQPDIVPFGIGSPQKDKKQDQQYNTADKINIHLSHIILIYE
jgi:hypothetical protein